MHRTLPAVVLALVSVAAGAAAVPAFADAPLPVVERVDLERYSGRWFEIASMPNAFQRGCVGTEVVYKLQEDGTLRFENGCRKGSLENELEISTAKATVECEETNAKLRVRFFWPLSVDYYIIDLDRENYQWAVVGHPSRDYLWVISREPKMDESLYQTLITRAAQKGFDVAKLNRTPQRSVTDTAARLDSGVAVR